LNFFDMIRDMQGCLRHAGTPKSSLRHSWLSIETYGDSGIHHFKPPNGFGNGFGTFGWFSGDVW
jgi:hypothetical protein